MKPCGKASAPSSSSNGQMQLQHFEATMAVLMAMKASWRRQVSEPCARVQQSTCSCLIVAMQNCCCVGALTTMRLCAKRRQAGASASDGIHSVTGAKTQATSEATVDVCYSTVCQCSCWNKCSTHFCHMRAHNVIKHSCMTIEAYPHG